MACPHLGFWTGLWIARIFTDMQPCKMHFLTSNHNLRHVLCTARMKKNCNILPSQISIHSFQSNFGFNQSWIGAQDIITIF